MGASIHLQLFIMTLLHAGIQEQHTYLHGCTEQHEQHEISRVSYIFWGEGIIGPHDGATSCYVQLRTTKT